VKLSNTDIFNYSKLKFPMYSICSTLSCVVSFANARRQIVNVVTFPVSITVLKISLYQSNMRQKSKGPETI